MRSAVGKRGLEHVDGATKDMVVLRAKGFGLKGECLKRRAVGMVLRQEVVVLMDCKFEG